MGSCVCACMHRLGTGKGVGKKGRAWIRSQQPIAGDGGFSVLSFRTMQSTGWMDGWNAYDYAKRARRGV